MYLLHQFNVNNLTLELKSSISYNVRKKTLRWFHKELGMTSEVLLKKLGGNNLSLWSGYLGGTRNYAKYEGYQRMAEAYGISEDQFIRKMEEFIREDLGMEEKGSNEDPKVAFFTSVGVSSKDKQDAILKMIDAFKDV